MKKYFLLFTIIVLSSQSQSQSLIVSSGSSDYTIGDTFQIMQNATIIESQNSLSVPHYELPVEKPKITKKKTIFDRLIDIILKLFKKK